MTEADRSGLPTAVKKGDLRGKLLVFFFFTALCLFMVWAGLNHGGFSGIFFALWGAVGLWAMWSGAEDFFE